ncbi:MAG: hypothetical protein WC690_07020, partial [bacterium]
AAATFFATARILSMLATEVPPYLWTTIFMCTLKECDRAIVLRAIAKLMLHALIKVCHHSAKLISQFPIIRQQESDPR